MLKIVAVFGLSFFGITGMLSAQLPGVKLNQMDCPYAHITDPGLIRLILEEFFIPEENVVALDIVDISRNGFGEDDVVIAYPSQGVYMAPSSEAVTKIMGEWKFKAEFEKDSELRDPSFFENLPTDRAQNAILADLLRSLERNYKDLPIELRFSRDSTAFRFQIWNYNPRALHYTPPPPPLPDTMAVYDVVSVIKEEKLIETDTTYYDIVYVFQSFADTLFIPESLVRSARKAVVPTTGRKRGK